MNDRERTIQGERQRFATNLSARLDEIEAFARPVIDPPPSGFAERTLAELLMPIERLHGGAAALGFAAVAEVTATLATLLTAMHRGGGVPSEEARHQFAALLKDLRAIGRRPLRVNDVGDDAPPAAADETHDLLIMADERAVDADALAQLGHFGYRVHRRTEAAALTGDEASDATVAIVDLSIPGALAAMAERTRTRAEEMSVMALGRTDDLMTRLAAVRAGARAFLPLPFDVVRLVGILDRWTHRDNQGPYRVLVVEDDTAMSALYARLLRDAGMTVTILAEPLKVMEPLVESRPEIIVMDVAMPQCSGFELAAVIRQREEFVQTPIVFLTGDASLDRRVLAAQSGGDEFFVKPIKPELLVSSVLARARRARLLGALIERDSMTGLVNHTRSKELLAVEVARAGRLGRPLAFAMLDIDFFKKVNDAYGHWVGDTVIKTLAHVLRQRLRRTDIVGRYGGEEFAVILPNTDGPTALAVLDAIRQGFKNIRMQGDGQEFRVTFSGGIATLPPIGNGPELSKAADEALYRAKNGGRDRVVLDADD